MKAVEIRDSLYSWLRLAVSMVIGLVASASMWAVVVIMPSVELELSLTRAETSMPFTLLMLGYGLGSFVIGRLTDRVGITRVLIGATLGIVASFSGAIAAADIVQLSVAHLALGLGAAAGFAPLMSDISHWFLKWRGTAIAAVASANYLSGAFWPTAMANVLAESGWRQAYVTLAVITFSTMIPLALLLRRRVKDPARDLAQDVKSSPVHRPRISPRTLQLSLGLAGIACCIAMSMPQVHLVTYCVGLGYGPVAGAEMLSLMLFGGVLSRMIFGVMADRLGGVRTLLLGSVLQTIGLALYLPYDGLVSLYVISLVFGLAQGGIVPSYALLVREYLPAKAAGAGVGFVLMMTIWGMALGGWMSGWIYDATGSYEMAFFNGIVWNLCNIGIVLALFFRNPPGMRLLLSGKASV